MYSSTQSQFQNPDYTKDYYKYYYNTFLNHMLVGTESLATALSMFPSGEICDVGKLLYDISHYKKGDKGKIVADLIALGLDGAAEYADEIIDVAKQAKRVVVNTLDSGSLTRLIGEAIRKLQKYIIDNTSIIVYNKTN